MEYIPQDFAEFAKFAYQLFQQMKQPNPDPVQMSAQPSAQVMAQSNAAAVEVMNNSTEIADLKAQIADLKAQMAALQAQNTKLSAELSEANDALADVGAENFALKSELVGLKQDIKIVEQYEGIDFQEIVEDVVSKDGQDYYEKIVKDLNIDDQSKHDLVKAYMDDQAASPLVDFETGEVYMPESRVELWFRSHPEVNRKDITEADIKDAAWEEGQKRWEENMEKKRQEQMRKQSERRFDGFGSDRGF